MTPQYADQSHGQVRRAGVESALEHVEEEVGTVAETAAEVSDVDSILDEIDAVIETNAAAFVQGFVQKGGQ